MAVDKSFQDILREKIKTRENYGKELRSEPDNLFWNLQARAPQSQARPKTSSPYPQPQKKARTMDWGPIETVAIYDLIRLGAQLQEDSHYEDIRREYHRLLHEFHPDHHQSKDELTQRRYSKLVQDLVKSFRLIKNSQENLAA